MKNYIGRQIVYIPILKEDFEKDVLGSLKTHLRSAISIHNRNIREIKELEEIYRGKQPIISEKKRYDGSEINNIVVENHAWKQVNFKTGFMYGKPLQYSLNNSKEMDDVTILNAYMNDVNKSSLDIDKSHDLYKYGIAYQIVIPKVGTIEDIDSEAPFVLDNLSCEECCVVYSNDRPRQKLFGLVITKDKESKNLFNVFLPNRKILLNSKYEKIDDLPQIMDFIAIQEYTLNNARMGIIELTLYLQNLVNKLDSGEIDDIEEFVNTFLVFENVQLDDDDTKQLFQDLRKERIIAISSNNEKLPAKFSLVQKSLDHNSLNVFYERIIKALYDIPGVPHSSGNVTSGGDTGQARLLGNGWENAHNQAQVDTEYLMQYERELLRKILKICKKYTNCPINELKASDISIKFNLNMSDNLLVKTQALLNLDTIKFPKKSALNIVGVTGDVEGVGNEWEKVVQEQEKKELEKEQKISSANTQNNGSNDNNLRKELVNKDIQE